MMLQCGISVFKADIPTPEVDFESVQDSCCQLQEATMPVSLGEACSGPRRDAILIGMVTLALTLLTGRSWLH